MASLASNQTAREPFTKRWRRSSEKSWNTPTCCFRNSCVFMGTGRGWASHSRETLLRASLLQEDRSLNQRGRLDLSPRGNVKTKVLCSFSATCIPSHHVEDVSGGDKCQMREALREVSDQSPAGRVVLLREQTEWRAKIQESLHQLLCFIEPATVGIVVGQPE